MDNKLNMPSNFEGKLKEINDMISEFGNKILGKSYSEKFTELLIKVSNDESLDINRGKVNTWGAGIVHAIFFVNDTLNKKGIKMDELADFFTVSEGTIGTKSRDIRKSLDITKDSTEWKVSEVLEDAKEEVALSSTDEGVSSDLIIETFEEALKLEDVVLGAEKMRECISLLKKDLGDEFFKENVGNIKVSAEGDFLLTVQSTLSNYEFALGNYDEAYKLEKELIEFDSDDTRLVRHSIIFRGLMVKDYSFVNEILNRFKDDDSVFFKYGRVLYYYYTGDRKNARKNLKKATKHNYKFIQCLTGNMNVVEDEITAYTKGSLEEASLLYHYSLPLWNNNQIGNWLIKALNKIK